MATSFRVERPHHATAVARHTPSTNSVDTPHASICALAQVSYFYDASLGDFYYGPTHPMKPHRVRMAHDLIVRYDLYKHLQVCCVWVC